MKLQLLFLLLPLQLFSQTFTKEEVGRWQKQANNVVIIRDNFGVPHIYGKADADAVFGLMYAQCEDDFKRVEMNYIEKLGRIAEVKGRSEIYNDLLIRMIIDSTDAIRDYKNSPAWLKKLMNAFADGINFYISRHPDKPVLLKRFQPWYPLLWTDGSIGAINTATLTANDLKNFYGNQNDVSITRYGETEELTGSNGFAFGPRITSSGNAMLYINPHVTFYFRPEVHIVSEEGLNAYGAVTWGQFFVYQGFNEHCGWGHTSSAVDATDAYIEKISAAGTGWTYEYEGTQRPVKQKNILIAYKEGSSVSEKTQGATLFKTLYTHHGPVMAKRNGQYLSLRADNRSLNGLAQCWMRNKAGSFDAFKKTLDLRGNISNNTVYADAEGNIAYWHGNRIPVRDNNYDWSKPVDGSVSATEWKGYHAISEIIQCINPPNGWLQNCNSTPFTSAGSSSPKRENYPAYMAPDGENFRGINAVRVLGENNNYSIDEVIKAGYDTRLAAFEVLIPALVSAFEKNVSYSDSLYAWLVGPIHVLKNWDYRCDENSIATSLAILWGEKIQPAIGRTVVSNKIENDLVGMTKKFARDAPSAELLLPLLATIHDMDSRYGRWQMPWGRINRFQRISTDIASKFDDSKPSFPMGYASAAWGMLPSYISSIFPKTQKRYGIHGNSFVCAVEFGKKVKAKSLLAGGQSGDPGSAHFFDQGLMYTKGQFKDVLFYKEDVLKNKEKMYHPGD